MLYGKVRQRARQNRTLWRCHGAHEVTGFIVKGGGQPRPIEAVMATSLSVRVAVVAGPVRNHASAAARRYRMRALSFGYVVPSQRASNTAFERTAAHVTGFAKEPQTPRRAPTCRRSRPALDAPASSRVSTQSMSLGSKRGVSGLRVGDAGDLTKRVFGSTPVAPVLVHNESMVARARSARFLGRGSWPRGCDNN